MPRRPLRIPSYRRHKPSGQAVVTLDGRDLYLGKYNTASSRQAYDRVINEWLAHERSLPAVSQKGNSDRGFTINELILAFWKHAHHYYRKDGKPTGEIQALRYSLRPLAQLYGAEPVANFGPRMLKAVRQIMIDGDLARSLINKRINRVRHVFKWGVENELVPPTVLDGLQAVAPLKRGRTEARESPPVRPVPQRLIDGVIPHVSDQVGAMIQLQLRTGMRPGEVVMMRRADVDTTGNVWIYCPESHKTEHHGFRRLIYLGPEAQMILSPYMNRMPHAYLFSPIEAEQQRRADLHSVRRTPLSYGNHPGTNRKRKPARKPRDRYDVASYRRAITRGCDFAFPWPPSDGRNVSDLSDQEQKEFHEWQKQHRWHPHQLRHNAATFLRREFGVEATRLILGHRSIAVTELYAELDHEKAIQIIGKVG